MEGRTADPGQGPVKCGSESRRRASAPAMRRSGVAKSRPYSGFPLSPFSVSRQLPWSTRLVRPSLASIWGQHREPAGRPRRVLSCRGMDPDRRSRVLRQLEADGRWRHHDVLGL